MVFISSLSIVTLHLLILSLSCSGLVQITPSSLLVLQKAGPVVRIQVRRVDLGDEGCFFQSGVLHIAHIRQGADWRSGAIMTAFQYY
jgi:hypothetical protein